MSWKQLLLDWEKQDRNTAALELHCKLCGLARADVAVLVAIKRHGERIWKRTDSGVVSRSQLRAPMRQLSKLSGVTVGAVHKAKQRLTGRRPEVMRHDSTTRTWVASWCRVWAITPLRTAHEQWAESDDSPANSGEPRPPTTVNVHGCSRPPQERESLDTPDPIQEPNQMRALLGRSSVFRADAGGLHDAQLQRFASRILARLQPIEDRFGVPPDNRLELTTARQIADGVCSDPDSDVGREFERVLGSVCRKNDFTTSPAAYLFGCARRRGWLPDTAMAAKRQENP